MADDDDILNIDGTDPRFLVLEVERRIRPPTAAASDSVIRYLDTVEHAYSSFGVPFPLPKWRERAKNLAEMSKLFAEMKGEVDKLKIDLLRANTLEKTSVTLDTSWRDRIHSYLQAIRQVVEATDLAPPIRERIMRKLHELQQEVDRNRASIQKFTDVLVGICEGISEGATALTPAVRVLERVIGALSRVKSAEKPPLSLPKPDDFGLDDENPPEVEPPQSN